MKKSSAIIVLCMMTMLLSACCIKHDFEEATCTEPSTCSKCGKTEGEALGHEWEDATCEEPETCSVCGETDGKALGHKWEDATCEEPKTCKVCDKTEGEALGHEWAGDSFKAPKVCKVCQTEGEPIQSWEEFFSIPENNENMQLEARKQADGKIFTDVVYSAENNTVIYEFTFSESFDVAGMNMDMLDEVYKASMPAAVEALEKESGVDSNVHILLSDATGKVVFDKMYDN